MPEGGVMNSLKCYSNVLYWTIIYVATFQISLPPPTRENGYKSDDRQAKGARAYVE